MDRHEALALFDEPRSRDPQRHWPLLPILAFIAPGGSGKSMLINYLRNERCRVQGHPVLPHAHIDFTVPGAPTDLLAILVRLRDELQQQADDQGKHLRFPRFDLGALVAQASSTADLAALEPHTIQEKLAIGTQLIESLAALGSFLGNTLPVIGPLVAGLKLALQLPVVRDTLAALQAHTGWTWYRQHGTVTGLVAEATMKDVLLRLQVLSLLGTPERETLVNELLPAAFAADLFAALVEAHPPQAWSPAANVVIFLDGYEALQRTSSTTAARLLQVLTTEPRKQGHTDPLLLVVGGRDPLMGMIEDKQLVAFARTVEDEATAKQRAHDLYTRWQQRLPSTPRTVRRLRLENLVLPLLLRDFGPEHTRSYLLEVGEREQTAVFADDSLVQAIDEVTHGHPLFLALAAEAVLEAGERSLLPAEFQRARVSPEIAPEHEGEEIGRYLLDLFLRQLPDAERRQDLVRCSVPRVLDEAVLRVLLPSLDDIDARDRWQVMRQRSFLNAVDEQRSVIHPVVRRLLLRRLPVSRDPKSDFVQVHTQLKDHFTERATSGGEEAGIEAAYHALALGDADPAIRLGILAQRGRLFLWESLLEAVRQAPTDLLPEDSEAHAEKARARAEEQHELPDAATAVVLYTWLLNAAHDREKSARLHCNLGLAYSGLPTGDRAAHLQQAIACYKAALRVHTRKDFPDAWARTQNNLGNAYWSLPTGDRAAHLQQAIACYKAALQVHTREAFPDAWARTQNGLGAAYNGLPTGDRAAHLQQAITYYEAALQVHTRKDFPDAWARTQNNLGNAYWSLPTGDRAAHLQQAITYYEAALQVHTREAFPDAWAMTQNNLGNAYSDLPTEDRAAHLQQAIACYQAALQVHTREDFPDAWARTQNNLGAAYSDLPTEDRAAHLQQAIACYQAALQVHTREAFPFDWAMTQHNLGNAYWSLPTGDRAAHLQQAIACYQATLPVYTSAHMDDYAQEVADYLEVAKGELQKLTQPQQFTPPQQTQPGQEIS
jgi:tetratricopeptide (TPR) repeat protein